MLSRNVMFLLLLSCTLEVSTVVQTVSALEHTYSSNKWGLQKKMQFHLRYSPTRSTSHLFVRFLVSASGLEPQACATWTACEGDQAIEIIAFTRQHALV